MKSSAMWHELCAIDRRRWARLEARFGSCPVCGAGATAACAISTVTWAACDSCETRWPVGEHVLAAEHVESMLAVSMVKLAGLQQLDSNEPGTHAGDRPHFPEEQSR